MIFNTKTILVSAMAASAMAMPNAFPEPAAMPIPDPGAMAMARAEPSPQDPVSIGVGAVVSLIPSIIDAADKIIASQGVDIKLHDVQPSGNPPTPTEAYVKEQIACLDKFTGGGFLSWGATMDCGGKTWSKNQKGGYKDVALCESLLNPHIKKAIAQGFTNLIAEHYTSVAWCSCWISF